MKEQKRRWKELKKIGHKAFVITLWKHNGDNIPKKNDAVKRKSWWKKTVESG